MEDGCFAQFAGGPENRRLTLNSEAAERFSGFFWRLVEMRSVGSRPIRVSSFLLASISTWDFSTRYLASFFSAAFGGWRTLAPVTEELAPTFCWFCEQLLLELLTQVPLHGDGLRSVGEKSQLHSLALGFRRVSIMKQSSGSMLPKLGGGDKNHVLIRKHPSPPCGSRRY